MYVIIWEFQPKPGREEEFKRVYAPDGLWGKFFKTGNGYIRSELLHDTSDGDHYCTLDFWTSKEAYETFRTHHAHEYKAIDEQCESLTATEQFIGTFTTIDLIPK